MGFTVGLGFLGRGRKFCTLQGCRRILEVRASGIEFRAFRVLLIPGRWLVGLNAHS